MFACCTKKDTSLEVALLDELIELNQRMSKIIKQLKFLKPSECKDRYIPLYPQIPLNALMLTRGVTLESVFEEEDDMVTISEEI